MRPRFRLALVVMILSFATLGTGCKNKDAKLKAAIEEKLKANPDMANCTVEVKDGVATISGECKDEMCKTKCCEEAKAAGAKDCVNNCTVKEAPKQVEIADNSALEKALADALKSYPTVKGSVSPEGKIILTGTISAKDNMQLVQALSKIGGKGFERKGLTVK